MWQVSLLFLQRMAAVMVDPLGSGPNFGPLGNTWLGLFVSPTPVLNVNSTMADITEAGFSGYARIEAVWDAPYFGQSALEYLEAQAMHFRCTGSAQADTITGFFFADALTAGNLLLSARGQGIGIPMFQSGNAFTILPRYGLDSNGNWGDFTIVR